MRFVAPTKRPRVLLFDIDNTLYHDRFYGELQVELLIMRLGHERGLTDHEAHALVDETRARLTGRDGSRPSLGNTFVELGIPISTSVEWRRELIVPEEHLSPDPEVRPRLERLARRVPLVAITNNPTDIGERSLSALGIRDLFALVVGLEISGASKPAWEPFAAALAVCAGGAGGADESAAESVIVGDRWEVDCEPIVRRGGGALLVEQEGDLSLALDQLAAWVDRDSASVPPE